MRKVLTLAVLATTVALTGIVAATMRVHAKRDMDSRHRTADATLDRLKRAIHEEHEHGCTGSDAEDDPACHDIRERISTHHDDARLAIDAGRARPSWARKTAEKRIRGFRGNDALSLTYLQTSSNPYRDDGADVETYADTEGFEYWIDTANDVLVQAGPRAGEHPPARKVGPDGRLPVPTLRKNAVAIAMANIPEFEKRMNALHPLEANKDKEVYRENGA